MSFGEVVTLSDEDGRFQEQLKFDDNSPVVTDAGNRTLLEWHTISGVQLRHFVPDDQLPYTLLSEPRRVSFRDDTGSKHEILSFGSRHAIEIPKYTFQSKEAALSFQAKARRRDLLEVLRVRKVKLKRKGAISLIDIAVDQHLKIWRIPGNRESTTLTIYTNVLKDEKHLELSLSSFEERYRKESRSKSVSLTFNTLQKRLQRSNTVGTLSNGYNAISANFNSRRNSEKAPQAPKLHYLEKTISEESRLYDELEIDFRDEASLSKFLWTCDRACNPCLPPMRQQPPTSLISVFQNWPGLEGSRSFELRQVMDSKQMGSMAPSDPPVSPTTTTPSTRSLSVAAARVHVEHTAIPAAAANWWVRISLLSENLFPGGRLIDDSISPVRVVCLDTGVDTSHPSIEAKWKRTGDLPDNQYRDFLLDQRYADALRPDLYGCKGEDISTLETIARSRRSRDTPSDFTGHGTRLASIFLQVAPNASLFIGRVFDGNQLSDDVESAAKRVALAILYAAQIWKADIISLSFGFTDAVMGRNGKTVLRNALLHVRHQLNVVVFAAPSNSANRDPSLLFPAKEPDLVICINSSNGDGGKSSFNPKAQHGHFNFSILGESVTCYDLDNWVRPYSGTSIANAMAAAVAALTFQFGRQYGITYFEELKSPRGICRVFSAMSGDRPNRDGFYDVVPWTNIFRESWQEDKRRGKTKMRDEINKLFE